ncbi:MAG: diguanylate cyclase [Demequinaceae bacterium]|nr:diguanylate cyclase [Demequinaceae bacterium]
MSTTTSDPMSRNDVDRALLALEDRPGWELAADGEVLRLEVAAQSLDDLELVWRARLLSAELACQRGDPAETMRLLRPVNAYATTHGHVRLQARSHLILAWTYREVGDLAASLEHAIKAFELLDTQPPTPIRAQYLIRLADALDECGAPLEARLRYQQAEDIAERHGDIPRLITCLNNRAYGEYVAGDMDRAQATINRLVAVSRAHNEPVRPHVLDTVARIQITEGRYEEAVSTAHQAIDAYQAQATREAISLPEFLLTLVVAQRHLGDIDAAQRHLDECRALGTSVGLASILVSVEAEQAELHAARGDFEPAFYDLKASHAAERALISEQRVAQSRLRQQMLETDEIRAEAERLRGEAQKDPLTGLYNRRFVDETLPGLLAARAPDQVIAAAMIDLDNFKRVNDMHAHAAGDAVLVEVARLLTVAARAGDDSSDGSFAARLGGEEFLLILQGLSRGEVARRLEELRHAVANADWHRIIGNLPMTMSAGVSWAGTADSQYTFLHRADKLLFTAKHLGRDRVCVEETGQGGISTD